MKKGGTQSEGFGGGLFLGAFFFLKYLKIMIIHDFLIFRKNMNFHDFSKFYIFEKKHENHEFNKKYYF